MLFPVATYLSVLFFLTGLVYVFFSLFIVSPVDEQTYRNLMLNTNSTAGNAEQNPYTAKQIRVKMQKQIFYEQGTDRLEMKIYSSDAELVFDHQENTTSIVEIMQNVRCYIQEGFYFSPSMQPMQRMLYLEAATARYDYKKEQITANQVKLSRYNLSGHVLVDTVDNLTPVMAGEAQSAVFDLGAGGLHFEAFNFKALPSGEKHDD